MRAYCEMNRVMRWIEFGELRWFRHDLPILTFT